MNEHFKDDAVKIKVQIRKERARKIQALVFIILIVLVIAGAIVYELIPYKAVINSNGTASKSSKAPNGVQTANTGSGSTRKAQSPAKTADPTPTARPVNRASVSNYRDDNSLASKTGHIYLSEYSASSELTDQYGAYTISNCFDGNTNTTWAEGESGNGIGSTISATWSVQSRNWQVTGVAIWAGYHKSSNVFYKNSRPRKVTLKIKSNDLVESFNVDLADSESCQYILFDYPIPMRNNAQIWLTIKSVYGGNKYTDTCITDIDLLVQRE